MMLRPETRPAWLQLMTSFSARLVAYGVVTMLVFRSVFELLQEHGAAWLAAENGVIELSQLACLVIATVGIFVAARLATIGRAVLVATGALTLYAAARESDLWFETMFFEDSYRTLVGIPVFLLAAYFTYAERAKILDETLRMAQRPGTALFVTGGLFLCFYCQMTDRPLFWSPLIEVPGFWQDAELVAAVERQKALVEESAELFAYLLIAFSGVEAMITAFQDRAALGVVAIPTESIPSESVPMRSDTALPAAA